MPNEVYLRTRDALATLVSERAATRVLDAALQRTHGSADGLESRAVRPLLLGPVQRELEGILPRHGLRRTLRRLAGQIADGGAPGHRSAAPQPAAPETVAAHPDGTAAAPTGNGAADRPPTVVPRPLGAEALDALAVHFAAVEGVLQVIALRAAAAPQVRGEGLDAAALAPLVQSAVRLLGRYGPLRSLVLEHEAGLLFIFPLGRDTLLLLARPNVNMGAVFAARAALEEGP